MEWMNKPYRNLEQLESKKKKKKEWKKIETNHNFSTQK